MLFPLATVLRCGMVFHWPECPLLDDPAYAGKTKAKFFVVLRATSGDPVVILLTNSDKAKYDNTHALSIPAGRYPFFQLDTVISVRDADDDSKALDLSDLKSLYTSSKITYLGHLSDDDTKALVAAVLACPLVSNRFKKTLA